MADITSPASAPSLPSTALPASGSRGLQHHTGLSAIAAPPQYCFLLRIGLVPAKSTTSKIAARVTKRPANLKCNRNPAVDGFRDAGSRCAAMGLLETLLSSRCERCPATAP